MLLPNPENDNYIIGHNDQQVTVVTSYHAFVRSAVTSPGVEWLRSCGAELIALAVIEVDANDDTARSFYGRFGFRSLKDDRLHMFLPMETARRALGKA